MWVWVTCIGYLGSTTVCQELLLCILLVSFTSYVDLQPKSPIELVEFFAGCGVVARTAESEGYRAVGLDILYDESKEQREVAGKRSPFDLNSDAGFAPFA